MKGICIQVVCLVLLLSCVMLGISPAKAQRKPPPVVTGPPIVTYNDVKDETLVVTPDVEFNAPNRTYYYGAGLTYPGKEPRRPDYVSLMVLETSYTPSFEGAKRVYLKFGKERRNYQVLVTIKPFVGISPVPGTSLPPAYMQSAVFNFPTADYIAIVNSKSFICQIGTANFTFEGDHLKSLKLLADYIPQEEKAKAP